MLLGFLFCDLHLVPSKYFLERESLLALAVTGAIQ